MKLPLFFQLCKADAEAGGEGDGLFSAGAVAKLKA